MENAPPDASSQPSQDNQTAAPLSAESDAPGADEAGAADVELSQDNAEVTEVGGVGSKEAVTVEGLGKESDSNGIDDDDEEEDDEDDEDEDEDEDDEEPQLKYARLTKHLGSVYRNGDATSAFLVAGDKMIVGTHNGNIHVIQLPSFRSLRVYHAHSASVTSVSISPCPPPMTLLKADAAARLASQSSNSPARPSSSQQSTHASSASPSAARKPREAPSVPNVPSNNIHIATSSLDGNVCVQSLIDIKDMQLRNFARPVQAVALSPDFKNDRTYLSGGLAGSLILTVGGQPGRSTSTTTGTAAAVASGWLGNMGLGPNTGKDTVLHTGEGTISTIRWSLSGRYVVWLNEHGIKLIRTGLHLDTSSGGAEDAWKRLGHIDRPQTEEWDTMATVWRGRAEWIDEKTLGPNDLGKTQPAVIPSTAPAASSAAAEKLKQQQVSDAKWVERLLVGWGSRIWIIHVHPGGIGIGRHVGERSVGRAEIVNILNMDCIISGISLYTQTLLLVLACSTPDDEEEEEAETQKLKTPKGHKSNPSTASRESEPSGGIRKRQNNLPPELRLIDLSSQSEVSKDGLSVSRYERLASSDYHLGVLPAQTAASAVASRGAFEALAGFGTDVWNAAINPIALFSSGASTQSHGSGDGASSSKAGGGSMAGSGRQGRAGTSLPPVDPNLAKPGVKIFIHSPYDCILATRRDLADHLSWLLERQQYQQAWELIDEHPEIVSASREPAEGAQGTQDRAQEQPGDDFYDDAASGADAVANKFYSSAEKEKRRIGELWVQELVEAGNWHRAGRACARVLGSADRWEKWVYTFAGAGKFDEIADAIPTAPMRPPIPGTIYEIVLGHYLQHDKPHFKALLDRWPPDLFDINTIATALANQLEYRDVREDSVEGGERGRDWRIVLESLAKLHEANGRMREALKCYIRLQDAESAMRLIKERHLADAVADDIPSFIALRVPADGGADSMTQEELEAATSEAVTLLVDEAQHGLVRPAEVVGQLQRKGLDLYTFLYLRGLLRGEGIEEHMGEMRDRLVLESRSLVDDFADLAVRLFAAYDRSLLMDFFKTSTSYSFECAVAECEHHSYVPELVYLYSKTGQTKRALYLIIDRLGDVARAIAFAREQDDPDLWEDLLEYSMDKPRFIHGLLDGVGIAIGVSGAAIDPVRLVRRIPEGLQIEGLREGLRHLLREHEVQTSISAGAARVLRSEVAAAQALLRGGQRKGIKFEIVLKGADHVDVKPADVPTVPTNGDDTNYTGSAGSINTATAGGTAATSTGGVSTPNKPASSALAQPPLSDPAGSGKPPPPDSAVTTNGTSGKKVWTPGHCARCLEPFSEWETDTLVGFACAHVFHLTHLLAYLHPGEDPPDTDFLLAGTEERERLSRGGAMHIGTKVTHARLLRDRIEGGCPVCARRGL